MSQLEVRMLGRLTVKRDGQKVDLLGAKSQELFCYLLLNRHQVHSRESLSEVLWEPRSTAHPRKYLRQALWQLQTALDSHRAAGERSLLHVEPDWIYVEPESPVWIDTAVLERAFGLAQGVPGNELTVQSVQALHEATSLYAGNLLIGEYHDWCILERERLESTYLALLDKLIDYCEWHHEYEAGLVYADRILRHDRAREQTHRRIMRLHFLAGDRATALRQFERCAAALREELSVRPSARTMELYRQIQSDQLNAPPVTPHVRVVTADGSLPEMLSHLRQIESMVADLHLLVQREINLVEQALHQRIGLNDESTLHRNPV
ncbi:MAG TPA: BTAD domain-containing putative transcriptional regulator [Thermomicrobiales bacterium]|jgi:DNA-binding SARP family transcriptional activator|nr:BTAD domain-containing putative transcriptional regulator [Thermomicrobiales bacterium]